MRAFAWRSALQPAFVAASVVWAGLLLLAPFVASQPHASQTGAAFAVAVYGIASLLCHQLPERSFRLSSAQMPVCARCAGIYFGAALAAVVAAASITRRSACEEAAPLKQRPTTPPSYVGHRLSGAVGSVAARRFSGVGRSVVGRPVSIANGSRAALIAAVVPTLGTLVYEWTTGHMPAHWIRATAGFPIGAVAAWLIVQHARDGGSAAPERVEG